MRFWSRYESLGEQMEQEFGIPFTPVNSRFGPALGRKRRHAWLVGAICRMIYARSHPDQPGVGSFRRERAHNARFRLDLRHALLARSLVLLGLILHARSQASDLRRQIEPRKTAWPISAAAEPAIRRCSTSRKMRIRLPISVFMNEFIARRASVGRRCSKTWEPLCPKNVRLMAIRLPQIDSEVEGGANRVELDMFVGTTQPSAIIGLLEELRKIAALRSSFADESEPTQPERSAL